MPLHRTRRPVTALAGTALVLVALTTGCGSSGQKEAVPSTVGPQSTLPESSGYTCSDPTGDISNDARAAGRLTEPPGVDIVTASAQVEGDELVVTYTMAGPISLVPDPFLSMFQGDPASRQFSWELRTQLNQSGQWEVQLATFQTSPESRTVLSVPVTVSGETLSYRVPLSDIPQIATLQWTFGATSTASNGAVVYDDCSSMTDPSANTMPSIVTIPPTTG